MPCDQHGEFPLGNVFIRKMFFKEAGDEMDGHTHNFDHTTIVVSGAVRVRATRPDGTVRECEFSTLSFFLIRADTKHAFVALAPDTLCVCVYAHRTPQGDVAQGYNGWTEAYG